MKRLLMVFAAFILFSTVLMAAGGRQGSGAQAATGGPVEIRARYWGEAKRFELYDKIIQEFEKVHPNVTVIREPSTWGEYWDKLNVQIAGGNAPDFLNMHPQYAADYPWGFLFVRVDCDRGLVRLFLVAGSKNAKEIGRA